MVDSFERSGSFSSDSSFSDTGIDIAAAKLYVDGGTIANSPMETDVSRNSSPVRRPLPEPPVHPSLKNVDLNEELTMEELLQSEGASTALIKQGSWGAKAWEEIDRTANVTVKKVSSIGLKAEGDSESGIIGESKSWKSGGSKKPRDEKRVVTAIFSQAVEKTNFAVEEGKSEELVELLKVKEGQLEEQVRSTSTLLEAFKMRLEEVERKVSEMEEAERQLQRELSIRNQQNEDLKSQLRSIEEQDPGIVVQAPSFRDKSKRKPLNDLDPQTIPALSQYVILVGIGVCAVVLRVVLKKVIGRKLKL